MGVGRLVQLALDLWDHTNPEPATAPPRGDGPFEPGALLSDVVEATVWQHPRANQRVRLEMCVVAYELRRGKRRTVGMSITPEGLSVRAPRWTPVSEVEGILRSKSAWLIEKLALSRQRALALTQARVQWVDGGAFDYLGQRVRMRIDPTQAAPCHLDHTDVDGPCLRLGLAHAASEEQIRDTVQAWLMRQAQQVFEARLTYFAPLLGVRWTRLRLSSAGTRWGSASADGTIRLNWRLLHQTMDMVDYVVVHELSHLRHMDHSPQFWDVVASILPDHAQRRRALNEATPRSA
jgi:predicted metal-dependent hydrolase